SGAAPAVAQATGHAGAAPAAEHRGAPPPTPQSPAAVYPQSPAAAMPTSPGPYPPTHHEPWMRPSSGGPYAGFPPVATTPSQPPPPVGVPAPPAPFPPDRDEPTASRHGLRVAGFVGAAVIGVVIGMIAIVVLKVLPDSERKSPEPSPSAATASIAADKAPTDISIDDKGSSVVITWTDHTGGAAPHYVVGGQEGASPRALTQVEKGVTEATIEALNPDTDYCFTVIAVVSVDEVAPSRETCTKRT
ncbi:MAG: fibronectin type III domain-containing protein, partial [Micromonosporaceae bacterium]